MLDGLEILDRDRLNHTAPERAAQSALRVIDHVSDHEPELQPVGLCIALIAYVRRTGNDLESLFSVSKNILASKDADGPAFRALDLYMRNEVR